MSPNNMINEQLFIDLLQFVNVEKLYILNLLKKLRAKYHRKNTVKGISLIDFVNFCLTHNIPSFD